MTNYRNRVLDRVHEFDERSLRDYPIRTLALGAPVTKMWPVNVWLDQGDDGACVGHGFAHELNAEPEVVSCNSACAFGIYHRAQLIDEWPGEDYSGTSVLAGAKVVTKDGFYTEYRWAKTEYEMAQALSVGPVVIGIDWYNDMFEPDANGYLHPTGGVAGGHCILVKGINVEESYYVVHNSWGKSWGDEGTAKISRSDMAFLIGRDGDVCLPVRVSESKPVDPTDPTDPIVPEPTVHCGFWCSLWKVIKQILGAK